MWLVLPLAFPCDPVLEVQSWIPDEGPVRQGTWLRARTDVAQPSAELSEVRGGVVQLEERMQDADRPDGWLGWRVPDDVVDDDWTLTLYDGADVLGSMALPVRAEAQIGHLEDDEGITWVDFDVAPSDDHPELCDTGLEAAYHRVTVVVDLPSAPANGWLVEVREAKGEPQAWQGMPRFGGEVSLSYLVHWTAGEACPEVVLRDGFHEEVAFEERGCVELPDLIDRAADDSPRQACGCSGLAPTGGLALVLAGLTAAAGRRGPGGGGRRRPVDPRRS